MKTLVIVPSKQRPEVFEKYTKPFITNLGLDSLLILEKEDYDNYNFNNKLELEESDMGIGYALLHGKKYAEKHGYELIFKIDDDVKEIGNIKDDLEEIYKQMANNPEISAVGFPYSFQFYDKSEQLFTHINKRLQTCYIIKTKSFTPKTEISTFEDFSQFLHIIQRGEKTLYCARHMIKCKPVGGGKGGCQCFDRRKQAEKEIKIFNQIDPSVGFIVKENKPWYYEPKFSDKRYKAIKLKSSLP